MLQDVISLKDDEVVIKKKSRTSKFKQSKGSLPLKPFTLLQNEMINTEPGQNIQHFDFLIRPRKTPLVD